MVEIFTDTKWLDRQEELKVLQDYIMTTTLTTTGWTGTTNGLWTDGSNTLTDNIGGVVNLGITANTLAGNDSIIGAGGVDTSNAPLTKTAPIYFGIENLGQIIMGNGQHSISGTATEIKPRSFVLGIFNEKNSTISIGGSNNSITGTATGDGDILGSKGIFPISGIYNRSGTITMGNGDNNSITGIGTATGKGSFSTGIFNRQGGTITMGDGDNNSITGIGGFYNGIYNRGTIKVGNGNNVSITGTGKADGGYGIYNQTYKDPITYEVFHPTIEIGNGNNVSLVGKAIGNDSVGIFNEAGNTINMGSGSGTIRGEATGNDSLGIFNRGTIDAGRGNDTLLSSVNNNGVSQKVTIAGGGNIYMGAGEDYFQGFGTMNVFGDAGTGNTGKNDTLDLGSLTLSDFQGLGSISKTGAGDNFARFTYNGSVMTTNEFDKFIFAGTTYSYAQLTV